MQVKSVGQNIGSVRNTNKRTDNIQAPNASVAGNSAVNFTGKMPSPNFIVKLMDFIAAGGFAASFCIQDGLGFIAPRVYKGLKRGGKKKHDENGNEILNKNGEPKRELNWAYARKEGLREVITGPSAFIIPWFLLKGINKYAGSANSVKLDFIDGFKNIFGEFAKNNKEAIINGKADKKAFYTAVYKDVLEQSINKQQDALPLENLEKTAHEYAQKHIQIEDAMAIKDKSARKAALEKLGSIEDDFMNLRKKHVGGDSNHMAVSISASDGKGVKHGSIGKLTTAMKNYFDDAVKSAHKALTNANDANIDDVMKKFTNKKMGSRLLTNLGLFAAVALFYTQIPKLYNMGTGGKNPALMNDDEPALKPAVNNANQKTNNQNVSFGSAGSFLEKAGEKVFNTSKLKKISDIFELDGPIIQGQAMSVLLYGACIPPRLIHAQDKYDYGEILVRDMTAFTALLFGAKALARLCSDGFTKMTGLALNSKNMEGRNLLQKTWDYLNPADTRHSVLSSKELDSKYTDIRSYKGGIDGFVDFIEKSGGDVKKALANDGEIQKATEAILKDVKGKSFAEATKVEIKEALHAAKESAPEKLEQLYKLFDKPNKLLNRAKTCNSFFGALSTLVLVPGLIIGLTDLCKNMTDKRKAKENEIKNRTQAQQAPLVPSSKPTMQGFLNRDAA